VTVRLTRRRVLQSAATVAAGLVVGGGTLAKVVASTDRQVMKYKGVNYDVGTSSLDAPVRAWHADSMVRDIRAIRQELHCNSIGIHGTDIRRLVDTSVAALESGLTVWIQPRLFDRTADEMLSHLSNVAKEAERLRNQYSNVILNVGCEISLLNSGFVRGATAVERIRNFQADVPDLRGLERRLSKVTAKACSISRATFKGPLTYGAGPWEWPAIDWSAFDFVGLDHYRDASNEATYTEPLREMRRYNKPVIVLEFGCCTFEGAEKDSGMGWDILGQGKAGSEFKSSYVRSERTQADSIAGVLDIFASEKVDGAFVYQFVSPELTHSTDPRHDLDMASYGVVKVVAYDPKSGTYQWEPKLAFHELAKRYGR
jgi:hypothetical protein